MIPKENSYQMMQRFAKAESDIQLIQQNIDSIQVQNEKKLAVVQAVQQYSLWKMQQLITRIGSGVAQSDRIVFADENYIVAGNYGIYGQTIHPAFVGTPRNVLNFQTNAGYVYRDIATVTINDEIKDEYCDILKHDSILDQSPVFNRYTSNDVTLTISLNSSVVSDRTTNVIELCPFLPGSFTILSMTITAKSGAVEQYTDEKTVEEHINISEVGAMRICLTNAIPLASVTLHIRIDYQDNQNTYPFGFKHIYFYHANFSSTSSVVVLLEKNGYIDYVSEDILFQTQWGSAESTCKAEDVKSYLYYTNGVLQNEIATMNNSIQNYIPQNVKKIYVSIPIKTGMIAFEFKSLGIR